MEPDPTARRFLDALDRQPTFQRFRFHFTGAKLVGIGLQMTNIMMGAVGVASDLLGVLDKALAA